MKHTLNVTTPSDREIVMTRVVDAPRRLVWEAMTKPGLIKRWLFGPPGWSHDGSRMTSNEMRATEENEKNINDEIFVEASLQNQLISKSISHSS